MRKSKRSFCKSGCICLQRIVSYDKEILILKNKIKQIQLSNLRRIRLLLMHHLFVFSVFLCTKALFNLTCALLVVNNSDKKKNGNSINYLSHYIFIGLLNVFPKLKIVDHIFLNRNKSLESESFKEEF